MGRAASRKYLHIQWARPYKADTISTRFTIPSCFWEYSLTLRSLSPDMHAFSRISAFIGVLAVETFAAIGPVTDLHIVNGAVSPDGISRQAVLAEGVFPGPLITGSKVKFSSTDNSMLLTLVFLN